MLGASLLPCSHLRQSTNRTELQATVASDWPRAPILILNQFLVGVPVWFNTSSQIPSEKWAPSRRSEKVQSVSSRLKVKGVICNKQSQNYLSKFLVKRLLCRKAHVQSKCQYAAKDTNSIHFVFFLLSKQPSPICTKAGTDSHSEGKTCEFSPPPPPTSESKTKNPAELVTPKPLFKGSTAIPARINIFRGLIHMLCFW